MSQNAHPRPDDAINAKEKNENPRKVLIVDDDPIIRDMMLDILEGEGYSAVTARNGHEALTTLSNGESYLVFLDMMMPGIDGREVCKRLDADPPVRRRHKIILMSALDHLDEATTGKVEGIIPKPFVVEDVLGAMDAFLG